MKDSLNSALNRPVAGKDLLAGLPDISQSISEFMHQQLPPASHPLGPAAHHHFKSMGKQIRARMALTAGESMDVPRPAALCWAAAVEMLHNASLVHDDISDGDKIRRGQPSVWSCFGRDTALALGDWLIALSFELAAKAGQAGSAPQLVSLLSRHMAATTTGQALEFQMGVYPDWSRYLEISTGKTAPLFIAPAEGIAHLAGRHDLIEPLHHFFTAAGGCYQIANDILNVIGKDGAASPASDLIRRAPNAVIVMFRTTLDSLMAARFERWLASGRTDNAAEWQERLQKSPALSMASSALMQMLDEAESSSLRFPADCIGVIMPIHEQLRHVCSGLSCPASNSVAQTKRIKERKLAGVLVR